MTSSRFLPVFTVLIAFAIACSGGATAPKTAPAPTSTPTAVQLKQRAEARYLGAMSPVLAEKVRAQPWFETMTQEGVDLIAAMLACEKDAIRKGEGRSVPEILQFASEQGWYQDGVEPRELLALRGMFQAYSESLNDDYAPMIGTQIATTLRAGMFDVVALPEKGNLPILVFAENEAQGREVLRLAVEYMPRVEDISGAYPYDFLHLQVEPELPRYILGVSYDQFIGINPRGGINGEVVAHEIAHSSVYGMFPLWFEEGLAEFVGYYLTGTLAAGTAGFDSDLKVLQRQAHLDVRGRINDAFDAYVERAQGFLLMKGIFDLEGIDGIKSTVRQLRTKTYTDQELLKALVTLAPPEAQAARSKLVCTQVVGGPRVC